MGCELSVELENGKISEIKGNTCPRGEKYARAECTAPTRCVTSTVLSRSGKPIPVKTSKPIPKDKIFECMKIINETIVDTPVKIGDIAVGDVFGADIIITAAAE